MKREQRMLYCLSLSIQSSYDAKKRVVIQLASPSAQLDGEMNESCFCAERYVGITSVGSSFCNNALDENDRTTFIGDIASFLTMNERECKKLESLIMMNVR